ncbi:MAG: HD domain-containing protein [Lachnospiraceae bacterium]|nr:HD domain-containing protein [Lachnospiraceae bacterium]
MEYQTTPGRAGQFTAIMEEMTAWFSYATHRVNHFLKVWAYARHLGLSEGLSEEMQFLLEVAALMHDIGIRPSEEKYHSAAGKYQETEGPIVARPILERHGFTPEQTERICYLIAHHHTYENMDGPDYQILVEADFLVNLFEEGHTRHSIESVREKIFRTASGLKCLDTLYLGPGGQIPAEKD